MTLGFGARFEFILSMDDSSMEWERRITDTSSDEEDLFTDLCLDKLSPLGPLISVLNVGKLFSSAQARFESDFSSTELSSIIKLNCRYYKKV